MLNHRITLQWRDTARNDLGEAAAWAGRAHLLGRPQARVGQLPEAQGQIQELVSHTFRIRWRDGLAGVTRVIWRGVPYDLTTPMVDPDGRRSFLELTCVQRPIEDLQPVLVDFSGVAFEANEKTQLGWSSNATNTDLLASLAKSAALGLAGGSLNVEFDTGLKTMTWTSTCPALEITSTAGDGRPLVITDTPTTWLSGLLATLAGYRQQLLLQRTGAAPQWQPPLGTKPAAHPLPTNMAADGALQASWLTKAAAFGVLSVINGNEPGHTLGQFDRYKNAAGEVVFPGETEAAWEARRAVQRRLDAASEVELYRTHTAAATLGPWARRGLASGLWGDVKDGKKLTDTGINFYQALVNAFAAQLVATPTMPGLDLVSLNTFNGKWWGQTNAMAAIVASVAPGAPFVATQWAPRIIKDNGSDGGDVAADENPFPFTRLRSAAETLNTLAALTARDDIERFHAAYWVGGADKAFLKNDGTELPRYTALKWWQQELPTRRVPLFGLAPFGLPATDDEVYAQATAAYGGLRPVICDDVFAVAGIGATAAVLLYSTAGAPRTLTLNINGLPDGVGPWVLQRLNEDGSATPVPYTGTIDIEAGGVMLLSATVPGTVNDCTRRAAMPGTQLLATRIHLQRGPDGLPTTGRARYCAQRDLATLGLRTATGEVACLAAWSAMPASLTLQPSTHGAVAGLIGARIDYGAGWVNVWSAPATAAPASVVVDVNAFAPGGWAAGPRQAALQLYLADAGQGATAQVLVGAAP